MAGAVISLSPLLGTIIASKFSQNNGLYSFPSRSKLFSTTVNSSFQDFAPISSMGNSVDFNAVLTKAESLLYTLADAAISASPDAGAPVQKNGGWSGFISDAMEVVLKVLKDGLTAVHIPYSYGFAIIFLTVLVKVATFPLTKQQVESTLAMQNLQPKIKAIQERYVGNQESGVGCISLLLSCRPMKGFNLRHHVFTGRLGSILWQDGHRPLGWFDTVAYLVLPVLLVLSQYVSMELMKPPQTDPSPKNSLIVLKFLPIMIGYFALSVPSGLSIYWFTNNVLSTAQQVWLRKLGGAKPVVSENASVIISAGRAKRSAYQPVVHGERFRQLKEARKQISQALPDEQVETLASTSESDSSLHHEAKGADESEEAYASGDGKQVPKYSIPKKSKRLKMKRVA